MPFEQEAVADTLEELWISYNIIEKVKGIGVCKKLKVLYMSNNLVKDWAEFNKLQELPLLEDLLFVGWYHCSLNRELIMGANAMLASMVLMHCFLGNPLHENMEESVWKAEAAKRLPNLKKLDGETVLREEAE